MKHGAMGFTARIYGTAFIPKLVTIGLVAAVTSGAQFVLTWYLGIIIDSIGNGLRTVLNYFAIISLAVAIYVAGNAILGYASGRMTSRFLLNLRINLGDKLCGAQYADLEKAKDGDILSIVTNDVEGFRPWLASLFSLGHIPIKMLVVCASIVFINWKLFFIMLPVLPLAMIPSLLLSKKLHALTMNERESIGRTTGFLAEVFNFMLVVKSFCLESLFTTKNRNLLHNAEKARLRKQLREQVIQSFGRCFGHFINPLIFILGGYFILNGEMSVGQIVIVMLLLNLVGEALNIIYAIPTSYQGAKANMERVGKILNLPNEEASGNKDMPKYENKPVFAFRELCFSYDEKRVLDNVNLEIRKGEKIAIVGMSGSGKTTLFKLLCGLFKHDSGSIEIFGQNIAALSVDALRHEMSVVPQESFLFADTLRGNLMLARSGASDIEMIAACKKARIHEFVMALANCYDTKLNDIGSVMSKGQMQRINLARAFLRDAPIWLFDEPTSALDPETHNAVMNDILNDATGKTIVMIVHSLSIPERFDRILLMHNGEVAGFGRHEALMQDNSIYRSILDRMAFKEEKAV